MKHKKHDYKQLIATFNGRSNIRDTRYKSVLLVENGLLWRKALPSKWVSKVHTDALNPSLIRPWSTGKLFLKHTGNHICLYKHICSYDAECINVGLLRNE